MTMKRSEGTKGGRTSWDEGFALQVDYAIGRCRLIGGVDDLIKALVAKRAQEVIDALLERVCGLWYGCCG
jgi:hypothetical protein